VGGEPSERAPHFSKPSPLKLNPKARERAPHVVGSPLLTSTEGALRKGIALIGDGSCSALHQVSFRVIQGSFMVDVGLLYA